MWLQCDVAGFGRGEHARAVTADVVGPTIAGAPANIDVVIKSSTSWTAKVTCGLETRVSVNATPVDELQKPAIVDFICVDGGAM